MHLQEQSQSALMPIFQNASTPLRFLTDDHGVKTDVVLSMKMWEDLVQWLEDIDDRIVVQSWIPHLKIGPQQSGALQWADLTDKWMSDE